MLQREELTVYKKNETTTLLDTVLKYLTTSFFNNQYESYKEIITNRTSKSWIR